MLLLVDSAHVEERFVVIIKPSDLLLLFWRNNIVVLVCKLQMFLVDVIISKTRHAAQSVAL